MIYVLGSPFVTRLALASQGRGLWGGTSVDRICFSCASCGCLIGLGSWEFGAWVGSLRLFAHWVPCVVGCAHTGCSRAFLSWPALTLIGSLKKGTSKYKWQQTALQSLGACICQCVCIIMDLFIKLLFLVFILLQNNRVLFKIRVVGGSVSCSYLSPQDGRPLHHPAVDR